MTVFILDFYISLFKQGKHFSFESFWQFTNTFLHSDCNFFRDTNTNA